MAKTNHGLMNMHTRSLFPELSSIRSISNERLPTNTTADSHPIHRWFNFIAGFSPEFVEQCCESASMQPGDLVLDPFAGCATTLVSATRRGFKAVGFEPHPVFFKIGLAKLPRGKTEKVACDLQSTILEGLETPVSDEMLSDSARLFLRKLFPKDTLQSLLGAREALQRHGFAENELAFLVLSKILNESSHSQTDGIYKAPTSRKGASDPATSCRRVVQMILEDILPLKTPPMRSQAKLYAESSVSMKQLASGTVSLVITSPPYLNNFDFAEMTRMYAYFWGIAGSWGEITEKIRSKLIVNTTTALKGHKEIQGEYRSSISPHLRPALDTLVSTLREKKKIKAGKKEYDLLVYPYFSQMASVLKECHRVMQVGASINIMVADAALYGTHISTPQILTKILSDLGFKNESCSLVRKRGHRWILSKREGSAQGLGEYHVHATR